jgi:RNA polymerase sigma-70 factor, ECF subfamily
MNSHSASEENPVEKGDASQWIEKLYSDLHNMASSYMRNENNTVSLSPTVLIHELYIRLPASQSDQLSRTHFFALAAGTMRRALVDHARFRNRKKRGGALGKRQLGDWDAISLESSDDVLSLDEALTDLARLDERQAQVVEMRFFGGMTVAEVADALKLSKRTVEADWTMAKAWLRRWFDVQD